MNPHQLQSAIETLLEGDAVNGVTCESVYASMARDNELVMTMFHMLHSGELRDAEGRFMSEFIETARDALTEVRSANMELEAGL